MPQCSWPLFTFWASPSDRSYQKLAVNRCPNQSNWHSALPSWGRDLLRARQLASCRFGVLSKQQISAGSAGCLLAKLGGLGPTNLIAPDEIYLSGSSCARPCSHPPTG